MYCVSGCDLQPVISHSMVIILSRGQVCMHTHRGNPWLTAYCEASMDAQHNLFIFLFSFQTSCLPLLPSYQNYSIVVCSTPINFPFIFLVLYLSYLSFTFSCNSAGPHLFIWMLYIRPVVTAVVL